MDGSVLTVETIDGFVLTDVFNDRIRLECGPVTRPGEEEKMKKAISAEKALKPYSVDAKFTCDCGLPFEFKPDWIAHFVFCSANHNRLRPSEFICPLPNCFHWAITKQDASEHGAYHGRLDEKIMSEDPYDMSKFHAKDPTLQPPEFDFPVDCVDIGKHLKGNEKEMIRAALDEFYCLFRSKEVPLTEAIAPPFEIDTQGHKPIKHAPRRVTGPEREVRKKQIEEWLRDGVIVPTKSPWSSPVHFVDKKGGKKRLVTDYRALNAISKFDAYPMMRIDDALDALGNANFHSSLDLKSGYLQLPVAENSKEKTAIATIMGSFQFQRLPFGLSNAPSHFQRVMNNLFADLMYIKVIVYIDDIIIFTRGTIEDHVQDIREVFARLKEANFTINPSKCHFVMKELEVLGFIVSEDGIRPTEDKIVAIRDFPQPTTQKAVRSFLGLTGAFRRFIQDYGSIARPLTDLTRKSTKFVWSLEANQAWQRLKMMMISAPILAHYDPTLPISIYPDASLYGCSAVICQQHPDGPRPIAYMSRKFNGPETRYACVEREALAIICAVERYRPYLIGRPVRIFTDNCSLCWLMQFKNNNARLLRWSLRLSEFRLEISHISGKAHSMADCLSRYPVGEAVPEDEVPLDFNMLQMDGLDEDPFQFPEMAQINMKEEQKKDRWIKEIIDVLEDKVPPPTTKQVKLAKNFILKNEILYRKMYVEGFWRELLVIPKEMRLNLQNQTRISREQMYQRSPGYPSTLPI